MPEKKLPDQLVGELIDAGLNDRQVAEHLFTHRGIKVTRQGVAAWRKRMGEEPRHQVRATPWVLPAWAYASEPARAIRWHARREAGLPLSDRERERLERVETFLRERGDGVFHWDDGWFVVPRRPGVDTGLYRVPDDEVKIRRCGAANHGA